MGTRGMPEIAICECVCYCSEWSDGVYEAGRVLSRGVGDDAEQDGAAAGRGAEQPARRASAHRRAAHARRGTQCRYAHTHTDTYTLYPIDHIDRRHKKISAPPFLTTFS